MTLGRHGAIGSSVAAIYLERSLSAQQKVPLRALDINLEGGYATQKLSRHRAYPR
jgi:hypothetical protein